MIKKLLIIFIILISLSINNVFSETGSLRERCSEQVSEWSQKINCPQFTIDVMDFSPGWWKVLKIAREWGWDTKHSANAILSVIIKNLIVAFGVLSLLVMTIGWGMMIFHVGQESILTKWKAMFMYWIISLIIALSSGIIIQLVSYFLY